MAVADKRVDLHREPPGQARSAVEMKTTRQAAWDPFGEAVWMSMSIENETNA